MGDTNVNIAALIGSRICHDLISPIGAISNGLELLDLTGGAQGPEMDLIADSVGNAGARIRFFRIAYGAADKQMMARSEVVSVLDDLGSGGRTEFVWHPTGPQLRAEIRLVFLALQCLETAMPYGGQIHVKHEDRVWCIIGEAKKLNVEFGLWDFSCPEKLVEITPALVQFALLPEIASTQGRNVQVEHAETRITLRF